MIQQNNWKPTVSVQARDYKRLHSVKRVNKYLLIDAQDITVPAWANTASVIACNMLVTIPGNLSWTIKLPIKKISDTFVPCIKWNIGGKVTRYKLWPSTGDTADFPIYNGESIPYLAELEIWTTTIASQITFSDWHLPTGLLVDPSDYPTTEGDQILTYWCRPFDTPITSIDSIFQTCQLPSVILP